MKFLINSLITLRNNRLFQSIHKLSPKQLNIKLSRNYVNGKGRDLNTKTVNEPIPNVLSQREKVSMIFKATLFTIGVSFTFLSVFSTY